MKNKFIILIFVLSIIILIGCSNPNIASSNKSNNKIISKDNITSLKIHNIKVELKDIKNKSEISRVVDLINSIKIVKSDDSDVEKLGDGYGVQITYSKNKIDNLRFIGFSMLFNGKWYIINKDIGEELRDIYNKI